MSTTMVNQTIFAKRSLRLGPIARVKFNLTPQNCTFIRSISSSRLCATTEPLQQHSNITLKRPGLMIPGTNGTNNISSSSQTRRFLPFPIGNEVINQEHGDLPHLPVPHDHLCRGSHEGWLVMVEKNLSVYLLNPLSGTRIDLPPVTDLPKPRPTDARMSKWYITKAILLASPSSSSDCIVMVVYGWDDLAFYRVGDKAWTPIEFPQKFGNVNAIFHKGKFYAINLKGVVSTCDITAPVPKLIRLDPLSKSSRSIRKWYLSESSKHELIQILRKVKVCKTESEDENEDIGDIEDKLLNCHCHCLLDFETNKEEEDYDNEDDDEESDIDYEPIDEFDYDNNFSSSFAHYTYKTTGFQVCKLDTTGPKPKWHKVKHLDGDALFLGLNQSFSISQPHLLGYKGNRIYFTDDHVTGHRYYLRSGNDMGVFNLEDSSFEPLYSTDFDSTKPPAIWITPNP